MRKKRKRNNFDLRETTETAFGGAIAISILKGLK